MLLRDLRNVTTLPFSLPPPISWKHPFSPQLLQDLSHCEPKYLKQITVNFDRLRPKPGCYLAAKKFTKHSRNVPPPLHCVEDSPSVPHLSHLASALLPQNAVTTRLAIRTSNPGSATTLPK